MEVTQKESEITFDRTTELKAFDDTKSGVKGLIDAGVAKVPQIFIDKHSDQFTCRGRSDEAPKVPIIDLEGVGGADYDPRRRLEVIGQIRDACESWGFFQVVNHGIPETLMKGIIDAVRKFHELDADVKREYYTRDEKRKFMFNTNFDFYKTPAANWRDSLYCPIAPNPPSPEDLPEVCRYKFEIL